MITAVGRARHRLRHEHPWVLDDPYALSLVGPSWESVLASVETAFAGDVGEQATAGVCARTRFAEDRVNSGTNQYVILGAGLDSFAWRRPDLLRTVTLFEVDHPASQAWKRERAVALALPMSSKHVFTPVDFTEDDLLAELAKAGFRAALPTVFSLVGVTYYLDRNALEGTFDAVAACAAGTELVLTYAPPPEFMDEIGRAFFHGFAAAASAAGEPIQTLLAPDDLERLLDKHGFDIVDHPTPQDIAQRYFAGRSDALTPVTTERFVTARLR